MISVLIATIDRPRLLERSVLSALAALNRRGFKEFEIIVGVNGPDEESRAVLERLRGVPGGNYIVPLEFGERLTPSACRNRLLGRVSGEWIYFLDDDAFVGEDFFEKWEASPLRRTCAAVGGPNLDPPVSREFQKVTSWALASRFATYFSSARYTGKGQARFCSEESLILCNLFVKKSALNEHSFLEDLECAEENWMLQNVERENHRLGYDPDLSVWHERRPDLRSFARQVFKYGFGRGQIFRRRPSGLRFAHLVPVFCLAYTALLPAMMITKPHFLWLTPYLIYSGLCLAFAFRPAGRASLRTRLLSAPLFPVVHACYGLGLIWGAVRG
jgi:glycosyltransferase involved in cell wall biosynthesis